MDFNIREQIDKVRNFGVQDNIDPKFKTLLIKSFSNMINGVKKIPKNQIKFNQIPKDVYDKLFDYYTVEKSLPKDTYINFSKQKLRHIGNQMEDHFLGVLTFIELIGLERLNDRYGSIDLYNKMIEEIRNLPDIKNSDDVIGDYEIFRKVLSDKDSPTRNLFLVLPSRFLYDYNKYEKLLKI